MICIAKEPDDNEYTPISIRHKLKAAKRLSSSVSLLCVVTSLQYFQPYIVYKASSHISHYIPWFNEQPFISPVSLWNTLRNSFLVHSFAPLWNIILAHSSSSNIYLGKNRAASRRRKLKSLLSVIGSYFNQRAIHEIPGAAFHSIH